MVGLLNAPTHEGRFFAMSKAGRVLCGWNSKGYAFERTQEWLAGKVPP